MLQINQKLLVKDGEIILPLAYTPSKEEEKLFKDKNITVKYTDSNGQLYSKEGDNFVTINPLKALKNKNKANPLIFSAFPEVKAYTDLNAKDKIFKGDIQIRFRGEIDDCIAHSLYLQSLSKNEKVHIWLHAIRSILGNIMAATAMDFQIKTFEIDGLSAEIIHKYSHNPLKHIGHDHIVPAFEHGEECIRINTLRTKIRLLENTAFNIYTVNKEIERPDILSTLNRLSSACYVLMIMLLLDKANNTSKKKITQRKIKENK